MAISPLPGDPYFFRRAGPDFIRACVNNNRGGKKKEAHRATKKWKKYRPPRKEKEKGRRIRVGRGREAAMKGGKRMVDTWAHVLSKEMKIPAKENELSLFYSRILLIKLFGPLNVSCMPNPFLLSTPVYASFRCLPSNPCCPSSPPPPPFTHR